MSYQYRVVGVNVTPIAAPDPVKASEQLKMSKEFIEKEFASHYQSSQATNTPLQVQNLLNIYGKRGWEHYYEGQIGDQVLLYFRRDTDLAVPSVDFTAEEMATTQMLAAEQRP
ncbi:hypothetical protein [Synechococcus sp. UW140]|uniref:hypothetical protein n=1 Tax=Synechococcus sp. UW140 TaxID=368503 RepID=UPI000E0F80E2|nr:hypothetical protein [Synechococcus sp. UW140]